MLNPFVIKKYSALVLNNFLAVILFFIGQIYYGFWGGLGFFFVAMILGILLGNLLLSNPFREMLEGKGLLVFKLDSTGIIFPFLMNVDSPYIRGKIGKKEVNDVFNRSTVMQFAQPKKVNKDVTRTEDGGVNIEISAEEFNDARFAMFHFPVLIWNDQINSFMTKDFLAEKEKSTFAEHGVLYLNRRMEELTSVIRDFARHVVETLKPQENFFQSKLFMIIIIVVIIILLLMFSPAIIEAFQNIAGTTGGAFNIGQKAVDTVTPRG